MARTLTMTFFILTLFSLPSQGQTDFRVMSYNVENLFDTKDDPLPYLSGFWISPHSAGNITAIA